MPIMVLQNCMFKELKNGWQVQMKFVLRNEMAKILECHLSCQVINCIMGITGVQQGVQSQEPVKQNVCSFMTAGATANRISAELQSQRQTRLKSKINMCGTVEAGLCDPAS